MGRKGGVKCALKFHSAGLEKKNRWCQNETSGKPECLGGFFEFRGTAMKTVRQCGAL